MTNTALEFLFLSEEDLIKAGVLDMDKCVETIDEMFRLLGKGDYLMGGPQENEHGIMLWFPDEKRFDKMPISGPDRRFMSLISYLGGDFNIAGEKWYGSNTANRSRGLPRSILTVTLNDIETGQPLAFMSGNLISAMRTGAVPGVAARYLARQKVRCVALLGAGVISRACIRAIAYSKPEVELVKIFDVDEDRGRQFAKEIHEELGLQCEVAQSVRECVEEADIISSATSGASRPVIEDEWLKEGCLIALTGTAELSERFYQENRIVADNWQMHQAWYRDGLEHPKGFASISDWAMSADLLALIRDGKIEQEKIENLGDIVLRNEPTADTARKTVFISGGLSTEDTAWATRVYQEAKANSIGQTLKLWDQPHWA
jgi:ornithine cyclodeaminase/alanine dehydrogenase-like protein (mu-crystallin family)